MLIVYDVGPAALFATIALPEIILFLVTKTIAVELQWNCSGIYCPRWDFAQRRNPEEAPQ